MLDKRLNLRNAIKMAIAANAGFVAALSATTAFAQQGAVSDALMEEIIVTGSRIPRRDLVGPSPVSVYDRKNIEQSGATSIGQLLREIPSVAGAAQTTAINNGGGGSQNISLRGIGSARTLVLINGRRAADSSGGNDGLVDLNTIPIAMVDRVEVLKDGASAIYGSDAIAGVVNIILRDDFDGISFTAQTGRSSEGDGEKREYTLTVGNTFDDSSYIFSITRVEEDETIAGNRSWARQAGWILGGSWVDGGSTAPPWGNYDNLTLGPDYTGGDLEGGMRAFDFFTDTYNHAPINFQRQPNERWILNATGKSHLETLSNVGMFQETRVFGEVSYVDRQSAQALAEQPLAPLAFYGFDAPYSADNAYNPTGKDLFDWRRRLVEDGPRTGFTEIQSFRGVVGFEGELAGNITWEVYLNYSEVDYTNNYGPLFNLEKVALSVGPTAVDAEGVLRCDTTGDGVFDDADEQACVPLDVFGEGSITPEMTAYSSFRQNEKNKATQKVWGFNLTKTDLLTLPGGDVGLAIGYTIRKETGQYTPDAFVAELADRGAVTGAPSDVTDGGYEADEWYAEVRLPIMDMLEIDLGIRYSDYDSFGSTTNWKVGVQFRPIDDLLLRGSATTSFRAPTIADQFGGSGISFPSVADPCAANPTQNCIANGVPAAGFTQISSQVRTEVGGNPAAAPEEADTVTLGLVYQPSFLPGMAVAIDFFDVEIVDPITTIGAGLILSQCRETGAFCEKITRFGPGPNEGAPLLIDNRITNAGALEVSGVDFLVEWRDIDTNLGMFGVRWEASLLTQYDKTQANGTVVPHDGFFRDDEDGHFAEWRWTLSGTYQRGPFTLQVDYRFIDEVTEFGGDIFGSCVDTNGAQVTAGGNVGLRCVSAGTKYSDSNLGDFVRTVDDAAYVDLYASYDFEFIQLFLGIDNALDEDPPLSVDGFNDNTDVRTFDTIGRYFYLGLRAHF